MHTIMMETRSRGRQKRKSRDESEAPERGPECGQCRVGRSWAGEKSLPFADDTDDGVSFKRAKRKDNSDNSNNNHYESKIYNWDKLKLFIYSPIFALIVFYLISRLTTLISAQATFGSLNEENKLISSTIVNNIYNNHNYESASTNTQEFSNSILPPIQLRPKVRVNIREWTMRLSDDIKAVGNRTNCVNKIKKFYENEGNLYQLDTIQLRDNIINQINILLAQHRDAVSNIVHEAELLAMRHNFTKNLRVNYTDVHRLRNELDSDSTTPTINQEDINQNNHLQQQQALASGNLGSSGSGGTQGPQFTSINGGTPVPGPPEWQTPIKSIVMQVNKNFGDIPVNTSMSAVHLPLPIYPGLPEIMNGIAWTEKLDLVFRKNLINYAHVHHQYYGDRIGFLRTFPAHKWRIPRTDPDLFDARTRPWYVQGASCPKNVVILIDTSGSMTGLRREIAKGVVFEILDTLTSNDYFSVMKFSETITPIGLPKCNLRRPRLSLEMSEFCSQAQAKLSHECQVYERQLYRSRQYLRDNFYLSTNNQRAPNSVGEENDDFTLVSNSNNLNGSSYLTDEQFKQSIGNITNEIKDAFLLQATSRNIRYLKSNFTIPTAGIANFSRALMGAFELLQAYERTADLGAQCNQAIMLITDGAIRSHEEIFNRYNYPNAPVRLFTYMIGREVGDITHTKAMACNNRGYYTHVINLSEVREQVLKYLPVMARPLVLAKHHPINWTPAYGDETHQVLTDWVLEIKRRERARMVLNEERERLSEAINSSDVINIELTSISEYDEQPLVDEELKNRIICEDSMMNQNLNLNLNSNSSTIDLISLEQSLNDELDPLGYNELACHWTTRRADLLTSVVKPVFDLRNTSLVFEYDFEKNISNDRAIQVKNAQLLGIAAVDLRIADILKSIPSHLLGPNGYAILMGQNGFIMHHPDLRALLEDPFDKNSKILKPYFNAVDLTHIEQVYHKDELDLNKKRAEDMKLFKLREAALRGQSGFDQFYVKRAIDCRRRPHIRQQTFHYTPIKETPFSLLLAVPSNYGLNKVSAKLELNELAGQYLKPSDFDLWTVHPEYKYCEGKGLSRNSSSEAILQILAMVSRQPEVAQKIHYDDLNAINYASSSATTGNNKITCDKELFPSLLFDAKATFELPDLFCGSAVNCAEQARSYLPTMSSGGDNFCTNSMDMRTQLASIYGLELSYVATRSGLTRVRVYDLSVRIKKLADVFIQKHSRAVDESWYSRTVDWNMRFGEDATIITAPYNAYVRLIAKLRQRITQRHPMGNGTKSNCDAGLDDESMASETAGSAAGANNNSTSAEDGPQNDEPAVSGEDDANAGNNGATEPSESGQENGGSEGQAAAAPGPAATGSQEEKTIDYNQYSTYDFLDLLTNSSVHISATQSVIVAAGSGQRSPVAVTGLLYDYATFARRFLNGTSLDIKVIEQEDGTASLNNDQAAPSSGQPESLREDFGTRIDICPNGQCAQKCGFRNDSIDCLLIDNNGFIIVGEELPYIGRPLSVYDERLMQSLIDKKVFHQINLTDYQAICARSADQVAADQRAAQAAAAAATAAASGLSVPMNQAQQQQLSQISSSSSPSWLRRPQGVEFNLANVLANAASTVLYLSSALYSLLFYKASLADFQSAWTGEPLINWAPLVGGQQATAANQSFLAILPNKTYLRPCERIVQLYETRPIEPKKLSQDSPEYYETRCNCSAWYVYKAVPKTNLIMLIVNTTSSCRRCSADPVQLPPQQVNNFIPIVPPIIDTGGPQSATSQPQTGNGLANPNGALYGGNKTAEDQVCAMLERDSQLYVPKSMPETCYSYNPEESQIHLCGGAQSSLEVPLKFVALCISIALINNRWKEASLKFSN